MAIPAELGVALKEWAVVCSALERGRQMVLLRKGGIHEAGGEFELEHRQFLLFPTYLHQNALMIKAGEQADFLPAAAEPARVTLSAVAEVTDIVQLRSRRQVEAIDDEHIWTPPLVDMRFGYRPENPLYLLLVRVHRLSAPETIENTPAYAGCKSWVLLDRPMSAAGAAPVMDDAAYESRRMSIRERVAAA
jgi:hypothetical protein